MKVGFSSAPMYFSLVGFLSLTLDSLPIKPQLLEDKKSGIYIYLSSYLSYTSFVRSKFPAGIIARKMHALKHELIVMLTA